MMGETVPPSRSPRDADPGSRSARPDTADLRQGLERLRENVQQRLDLIETLLRVREANAEHDEPSESDRDDEAEHEYRKRAAELDAAHRQAREADRWAKERQAAIEQIEHDRKLLAESWERLEREQTESRPGPARPAAPEHSTPPRPRPGSDSDHDDPVARDVLRQFQALRRDVRRNANGRS